jgi:hypothetical protein
MVYFYNPYGHLIEQEMELLIIRLISQSLRTSGGIWAADIQS